MNVYTEGVWVWTKKAEAKAVELGLEKRKANTLARLAGEKLGHYAPRKWVELGYVDVKGHPLVTKVTAYYKGGHTVEYKYDGESEHNGKIESARDRAIRQMENNKKIERYVIGAVA